MTEFYKERKIKITAQNPFKVVEFENICESHSLGNDFFKLYTNKHNLRNLNNTNLNLRAEFFQITFKRFKFNRFPAEL